MVDRGLEVREQAYRSASRAYDYFVTGLSAALFLATAFAFEASQRLLWNGVDATVIILFALAVVMGVKKLEHSVAVLGADYSIALTEANQAKLTVRESTAVLRDLNEAVESFSSRASVVHQLRTWFLALGILAMIASRLLRVVQAN